MKKLILGACALLTSILAKAQDSLTSIPVPTEPNLQYSDTSQDSRVQFIDAIVPIFIIGFILYFTFIIIKYILDNKLKNKIIDNGISEDLSAIILSNNNRNKSDQAIKSSILLMGIGIGLIITYNTLPLHLHSLAIMAISVAMSYLVYFFYLKNQKD